MPVRFSRFVERHGKSCQDGHFRVLGLYLHEASLRKDVDSVDAFVLAMQNEHLRRLLEKAKKDEEIWKGGYLCIRKEHNTWTSGRPEDMPEEKSLRFPGLQCTYCCESDGTMQGTKLRVKNLILSDIFTDDTGYKWLLLRKVKRRTAPKFKIRRAGRILRTKLHKLDRRRQLVAKAVELVAPEEKLYEEPAPMNMDGLLSVPALRELAKELEERLLPFCRPGRRLRYHDADTKIIEEARVEAYLQPDQLAAKGFAAGAKAVFVKVLTTMRRERLTFGINDMVKAALEQPARVWFYLDADDGAASDGVSSASGGASEDSASEVSDAADLARVPSAECDACGKWRILVTPQECERFSKAGVAFTCGSLAHLRDQAGEGRSACDAPVHDLEKRWARMAADEAPGDDDAAESDEDEDMHQAAESASDVPASEEASQSAASSASPSEDSGEEEDDSSSLGGSPDLKRLRI